MSTRNVIARTVSEKGKTLFQLPESTCTLEEANLPVHVVHGLAGRTLEVQVKPEELPGTRRVKLIDSPLLIYPDGSCWNDYRPMRVSFIDPDGKSWWLPRRWFQDTPVSAEPAPDSHFSVEQPIQFPESIHLPTEWDLLEINVPEQEAGRYAGKQVQVSVRIAPGEPVNVYWRDSWGIEWRIPHNWRRRRVRIPDKNRLIAQGVPPDVADEFANQIVSVNYHPESLCCLPDQYRFRDQYSNRYPVYIKDCVLMGYGDAEEHFT